MYDFFYCYPLIASQPRLQINDGPNTQMVFGQNVDGLSSNELVTFSSDLRHILERDWDDLGPKLKGKFNIYCGDMNNYYLGPAEKRFW